MTVEASDTAAKVRTSDKADSARHLVERAKANDAAALTELLSKLRPAMVVTISSYLRDHQNGSDCGRGECLTDAERKVAHGLASCQYRGEGPLEGWSREIALNATRDYLRSKGSWEKLHGLMPVDADGKEIEAPDPLNASKTVGSHVADDEILNLVREELIRRHRIPTDHSRVLHLRFYENQSYRQMGVALGCSHEEARRRLERAIAWVKANLSIVTKIRKACQTG